MQKQQPRTAGSNSKEFRGLGANFWTKLQFLLNRGGLRVDIGKVGVSLEKLPVEGVSLNLGAWIWIGWLGFDGLWI